MEFVRGHRPALVATVSPDGMPNVAPKGSLTVLDDEHLVFADLVAGRTSRNLSSIPVSRWWSWTPTDGAISSRAGGRDESGTAYRHLCEVAPAAEDRPLPRPRRWWSSRSTRIDDRSRPRAHQTEHPSVTKYTFNIANYIDITENRPLMPGTLTVGERIILHLAQYSKYLDSYDAPLDISQDGIAAALRISRAHAAIELKKLKDTGEVVEKLVHIKRGKTKRKVYFLSSPGEERGRQDPPVRGERGHRHPTVPGPQEVQGP